MAKLMENYSEKVLASVCGASGIALKQKYLPSLFELRKALDEAAGPELSAKEWNRLGAEQRKEREEELAVKDKGKYPTLESMQATYPEFMQKIMRGEHWDKPAFDPVKCKESLLAKYNVSEEEFNAIPNQEDYNWQTMKSATKTPAKPLPENQEQEETNPFE